MKPSSSCDQSKLQVSFGHGGARYIATIPRGDGGLWGEGTVTVQSPPTLPHGIPASVGVGGGAALHLGTGGSSACFLEWA